MMQQSEKITVLSFKKNAIICVSRFLEISDSNYGDSSIKKDN